MLMTCWRVEPVTNLGVGAAAAAFWGMTRLLPLLLGPSGSFCFCLSYRVRCTAPGLAPAGE